MKIPFRNQLFSTFIVLQLAFVFFSASSCRILKRDQQSIAEKKQEKAAEAAHKEYEQARKQHYKHQNKETQKMMKRTRKKADKVNDFKKRKGLSRSKCS